MVGLPDGGISMNLAPTTWLIWRLSLAEVNITYERRSTLVWNKIVTATHIFEIFEKGHFNGGEKDVSLNWGKKWESEIQDGGCNTNLS